MPMKRQTQFFSLIILQLLLIKKVSYSHAEMQINLKFFFESEFVIYGLKPVCETQHTISVFI